MVFRLFFLSMERHVMVNSDIVTIACVLGEMCGRGEIGEDRDG